MKPRTIELRNFTVCDGFLPVADPTDFDRSDLIYRRIHAALMAQQLPPGTRLPEVHLAAMFGVSRTLVRQALQRLAHDHLVVQEPNRGARVAEPSIEDVRHLYEVRRLLECAALADADLLTSRTRIAALKRLVADEAKANRDGDVRRSMQLSGRFHLDLMEGIGNPVLLGILRDLIARGNVAIALYEVRGRASCRCDDHRQILQALANRESAQASDLMRRHLVDIEESLTLSRQPLGPIDLRAVLGAGIVAPARSRHVNGRKP